MYRNLYQLYVDIFLMNCSPKADFIRVNPDTDPEASGWVRVNCKCACSCVGSFNSFHSTTSVLFFCMPHNGLAKKRCHPAGWL